MAFNQACIGAPPGAQSGLANDKPGRAGAAAPAFGLPTSRVNEITANSAASGHRTGACDPAKRWGVMATSTKLSALAVGMTIMLAAGAAPAQEMRAGGKLLLTDGVTNIEGASGGGLATWAVIGGDETRNGIGGSLAATAVHLPAYDLRVYSAKVGLFDRIELSYAHQEFDTGSTGGKLGLGDGFTFDQDVFGAKVKLVGDAVYGQDSWVPQLAAGLQYKVGDKSAIIHAVGSKSADGVDYYVAATKLLLNESLLVDTTVRYTKANQTGILGFGGDRHDAYSPQFEGSVGYLLTRHFIVGAEYRTKPDNLGVAKEDDWSDLFAAYAFNSHLSLTAAYVDAGSIVTFENQRGLYLSLQAGF